MTAACGGSSPTTGVDSAGGSDGGGTIDGATAIDGGTAPGAPGGPWTAMTLIDDPNPDRPVPHRSNDLVTGIYFETADKGVVVTRQDGLVNTRGGAVFLADRNTITSIAFSGDDPPTRPDARHTGSTAFVGLERTPTGYIALAYANETIASDDGGATFTLRPNSTADRFGIEATLAYQVSATGTTIVRETGIISVSDGPPGPNAVYQDIWRPAFDPSLPAAQCHGGPRGSSATTPRYSSYVSSDRRFLAYTANPAQHPEICISTDGAASFFPHPLEVPPDTTTLTPTGVTFTSTTTGITWFASRTLGAYIRRTTDGGATWTGIALPPELASAQVELPAGFFAPDGQHGWLAGFDYTAGKALALRTTDGGATWGLVTDVADAVTAAGGDKLRCGFALDATHVWLGGDRGLVLHN
ncbi:MAG: hypothetical protein ABIY55_04265 [Kofleriaceae bacterium]